MIKVTKYNSAGKTIQGSWGKSTLCSEIVQNALAPRTSLQTLLENLSHSQAFMLL